VVFIKVMFIKVKLLQVMNIDFLENFNILSL
jgi:hypothetical protein